MINNRHSQSNAIAILAFITVFIALLLSSLAVEAETLYVNTDGSNINDGKSREEAKETIQAAIDAASPDDVIQVAAGTYHESLRLKNIITLLGEGPDTTRIEYKGSGVVINAYGLSGGEISGFTIVYAGGSDHPAVWLRRSSVTIKGNIITGSVTAIDIGDNGDPLITDNQIIDNRVGIYIDTGARGRIFRNIISGNEHRGITIKDGADPQVINNEIRNNAQSGVYIHTQAHGVISGNVISDNGYRGITIKDGSDPEIDHNTVVNNAYDGIWIYLDANPVIHNNIVAKNGRYGIDTIGYYHGTDGRPTVSYNDVWGNERGSYNGIDPPATGICVDPLFADFENGDYRLQVNSPCRGAGDDGEDMGAYLSSAPPVMQPPSVSITSTFNTWESGKLTIEADATDAEGEVKIVMFEYSLDGGQTWHQIGTDTTSPYSIIWDTRSVIGTLWDKVWVRATATDSDDLTDEDNGSFSVDNEKPTASDDYSSSWRKDDFSITLESDDGAGSGVASINYSINDGGIKSVSADGHPLINSEGNNELEYWSVDSAGNEEEHNIISNISLDKTPPSFSDWVQTPVNLTQNHQGVFRVRARITDPGGSGVSGTPSLDYRIGTNISYRGEAMLNDGSDGWYFDVTADWSAYAGKTLYCQMYASDAAGNTSTSLEYPELIDSSGPPDYVISATETEITATDDGLVTYLISLEGENGFESNVTLFPVNLPSDVDGALDPGIVALSPAKPQTTCQMTLTLPNDMPAGDCSFTIIAIPESGEVKELSLKLIVESVLAETTLTLTPEIAEVLVMEELTLSGQLMAISSEPLELNGMKIQIVFTSPGGEAHPAEAETDDEGKYQVRFMPDEAGGWRAEASFEGNAQLKPSSYETTFAATKAPASIVFDTESIGTSGTGMEIVGSLEPQLEGETLNLMVRRPDDSISTLMDVTTEASGIFRHTLEPDEVGDWKVSVTWPGNDQYESAEQTLVISVSAAANKGDVNSDGSVRSNDAILTLRISVGLMTPTDGQEEAADMNDDGRIRSNDAILILRNAVGLPTSEEQ